MSYKMPKLTDKRKLCPRCGAPMMSKSETVRYCPVCHFTESTTRSEIKIKIDMEEKKEAAPKVEIYRVTAAGATKETSLESESSYVVVDRISNILWIWKGAQSSAGEAYKAGVQSTKLKSSLKMYSAEIKRVEEGEEPDNFPEIGEEVKVVEQERQRKEEEEKQKRLEEEKRKQEEEERLKKEEEERLKREEEERKRQEEEEKRQAEIKRQQEEEERKRQEEEEKRQAEIKKQQEEEERKRQEGEMRREEEARRREAEAEQQRLAAEKEIKEEGEEGSSQEVWTKVAQDTKSDSNPSDSSASSSSTQSTPEEAHEMEQAISSLTLVRGINEELAVKLIEANIISIMELSLCSADDLSAKCDIDIALLREVIRNAKDVLGLD